MNKILPSILSTEQHLRTFNFLFWGREIPITINMESVSMKLNRFSLAIAYREQNSFTELQHCSSCFFFHVHLPFMQLFHLCFTHLRMWLQKKNPCTHSLTVEPVNDPVHFRNMYRHYYYHPGIVSEIRIPKEETNKPVVISCHNFTYKIFVHK